FTGKAVNADPVAVVEDFIADGHAALDVVNIEGTTANDANLAHLPADQSRVTGGATECRQDAVGRLHAADVFGAGLAANQDDATLRRPLAVLVDPRLGILGVKLDAPRRGSRTGVDALGQKTSFRNCFPFGLGVKERLQELVEIIGRNPRRRESLFLL